MNNSKYLYPLSGNVTSDGLMGCIIRSWVCNFRCNTDGGAHHLRMLLMLTAIACPFSSTRISPVRAVETRSFLSTRYMYTRMYECARYQPVLHVRITRNDRPGRSPLTLRAPAFLQRSPSSKQPPNYILEHRGRGGTDVSSFKGLTVRCKRTNTL